MVCIRFLYDCRFFASYRSRNPRFTPQAIKANRVVVDLLERIAAQKGATPAQIALAWLLAQGPWIVPIPGSRKLERLEENLGAADVTLTPDDLSEIKNVMSQITVVRKRYYAVPRAAWSYTSWDRRSHI